MLRANLLAIGLFCTVAACTPAPEVSASPSDSSIRTSDKDPSRPDISAEKIARDVVGAAVEVTAAEGDGNPTAWTFEAGESRQVEVLEREATPKGVAVTVFMITRDNPEAGEDTVLVSGKLKLYYVRENGDWVLTAIENLTFRYRAGIAT